jgi:hypothetical protein
MMTVLFAAIFFYFYFFFSKNKIKVISLAAKTVYSVEL